MSAVRESDPQSFSDDGRGQRPWIIGGVVLALATGILWLRPWVDDYSEIDD